LKLIKFSKEEREYCSIKYLVRYFLSAVLLMLTHLITKSMSDYDITITAAKSALVETYGFTIEDLKGYNLVELLQIVENSNVHTKMYYVNILLALHNLK